MKARDPSKNTLSLILSEFKQEAIRARSKAPIDGADGVSCSQHTDALGDEAALRVLGKMAKQRMDSMSAYTKGGRADLVQKEQAQLDVLRHFLPVGMSEEEIRAMVLEVVAQTGASSMEDMGKVMGSAMKRAAGRAAGSAIHAVVEEVLAPAREK
jgi:uncharacterized protein YqeY